MPVCDMLYILRAPGRFSFGFLDIQFCARPADAASDFGCGVLQLECSVDVFALYRRSSDMTGSWGTTTIRTTENQTVTFEATGSDRSKTSLWFKSGSDLARQTAADKFRPRVCEAVRLVLNQSSRPYPRSLLPRCL